MSPIDSSSSPASLQFAAPPPLQEGEERACGANLTGKKPAWNVQMNGASNGESVISDDSWPALSQSAKGIFKSSLSDTNKTPQDQLISAPLGSVMTASQPVPYFPLLDTSSSPSLLKPDAKLNSVNMGDCVSSTGVPAIVTSEAPQLASLEQRTKMGFDVVSDSSTKDPPKGKNNWDRSLGGSIPPQNRSTTDHYDRSNGIRRTQNGGWVSHQGGYGKRQDHKLGGYERNLPPHANMLLPPPRGYFRHFIRTPQPAVAPFFSMPVQVRPLVGPMGYPEAPVYFFPPPPLPEKLRNAPFVHHQAPSIIVRPVDNLRLMILKQIEYYFSTENLCKDVFLKTNMDNQGWVPVSLIAGFNRVKKLTNDIAYILDALRDSTVLEVQGDKIRRRKDWMNWILPSIPKQYGIVPGARSLSASDDGSLAASDDGSLDTLVQNLGLEDGAACQTICDGMLREVD